MFTSILAKPALSGYGASSSVSNLCYELNPGGTCRPPVDLLSLGVPPRQKKEGGKGNGGGVRRGEEGREGEGRASARLLGGQLRVIRKALPPSRPVSHSFALHDAADSPSGEAPARPR